MIMDNTKGDLDGDINILVDLDVVNPFTTKEASIDG